MWAARRRYTMRNGFQSTTGGELQPEQALVEVLHDFCDVQWMHADQLRRCAAATAPACGLAISILWVLIMHSASDSILDLGLQAGRHAGGDLPEAGGPEPHGRAQDQQLAGPGRL